ncbi:response regulator transcription factor [Clostridium uliginosum]|uniref:Stage 0 sporulation protein A homolog n=1 Tax=Clostridium uliginosum TaxID=119641 RepID=A0A1I1RI61_9CLOT|nr:response regulator transcription factor [Clostridium uliginosum]SFD33991.1 DNA-binding response regulator, OmpR family, contains REC and winged-helix (wHTH) domain [Clostridium uliginosum]
MNIDILVVDDEVKIVEVAEAYLKKEGYNVITAHGGREALSKYNEKKPSLIVLDLMLPDISGEEVCKEIRKTSDIPIIILTAKVEENNVLNGFSLGADDYIRKPFSTKELVARINVLLKRSNNIKNSHILSFNNGNLIIDTISYEIKKNGVNITLTPSEYKLLLTLAKNPKKVFTRTELLDRTLGNEADVYDRAIDSHIKNLRAKVEESNKAPKYIVTVHGIGYKFGGE